MRPAGRCPSQGSAARVSHSSVPHRPLGARAIDNRPLIAEGLCKDAFDPSVITEAFIDRWAEFQRAAGHREIPMSADLGSLASASDTTLAALHVPTLVLHGEADPIILLASGQHFAAAIPGATLIVYPNVGHLPQVEIPAQSAGDVAKFLAELPAAPLP